MKNRKDNYVIICAVKPLALAMGSVNSVDQLIEWINELNLVQSSESTDKVKGQIDDVLTSLEV